MVNPIPSSSRRRRMLLKPPRGQSTSRSVPCSFITSITFIAVLLSQDRPTLALVTVVANARIVRLMFSDKRSLYPVHFRNRHITKRSQNLLADAEISAFSTSEICRDSGAIRAAKIVDIAGSVLSDVDFPIRIGDLINLGGSQPHHGFHSPLIRSRQKLISLMTPSSSVSCAVSRS